MIHIRLHFLYIIAVYCWFCAISTPLKAQNANSSNTVNADASFQYKLEHSYNPEAASKMEITANTQKLQQFLSKYPHKKYFVFTENRLNSIRPTDAIPVHWLSQPQKHLFRFKGQAQPGECYVFQLGIYAANQSLQHINLKYSTLTNTKGRIIPTTQMRCFNLAGTGPDGKAFTKQVNVAKGKLQALWVAIDVNKQARGLYKGKITVTADNAPPAYVDINLLVQGPVLHDHGYSQTWRLSRLRWLDSTIAQNTDNIVAPFTPIKRNANELSILGRKIILSENGLPRQIKTFFSPGNTHITTISNDILAAPMRFIIETTQGEITLPTNQLQFLRQEKGVVTWQSKTENNKLKLTCKGRLEPDGYIQYKLELEPLQQLKVKDVQLQIPYRAEFAKYMMGLGQKGGLRPDKPQWKWKWNTKNYQDCLWMGRVNAGMQIRLIGANYHRPLLNIYYKFHPLSLPESWGNNNKGGVSVTQTSLKRVLLTAFSGPRTLTPLKKLHFNFDLYITPFKTINQKRHWTIRYMHPHQGLNDPHFDHPETIVKAGANTVNMHHNQNYNPFINYPYNDLSFPDLIQCVKNFHKHNLKLKVYYTTREITNNMAELYAMYSLNGEIIFPGPGNNTRTVLHRKGSHRWYQKHLQERYIPAWTETIRGRYKNRLDLAVITTPDTRWNNFYLEGLNWLIKKADIDGVYIDDTALDRRSLQRARRILDTGYKGRLIDLHSWNHFNSLAKYASCANIYMEIFPYVNRIWFGEGFNYNKTSPDYWLIEISGIPYGLMGEMLNGGGNPWRGMVYGMTTRLGWSGNPTYIWKLWDDFGITNSEMIGYWDPACPVKTNNPDVLATVYKAKNKALIALASWHPTPVAVKLNIDWLSLGLTPKKTTLYAPPVKNYQKQASFNPGDNIPLYPARGWLLILSENNPKITNSTKKTIITENDHCIYHENFSGNKLSPKWKVKLSNHPGTSLRVQDNTLLIHAPANCCALADMKLPHNVNMITCKIKQNTDKGQAWGSGMALIWNNGNWIGINPRMEGNFGIHINSKEIISGTCSPDDWLALVIRFEKENIIIGAIAQPPFDNFQQLYTIPLHKFPGLPAIVRIGKIGHSIKGLDHTYAGSFGVSQIKDLRIFSTANR